jgi:tetratricopeptide (TPR) repeat protein
MTCEERELIQPTDQQLLEDLTARLRDEPSAAAKLARERLAIRTSQSPELRAELYRTLAWAALELEEGANGLRHARAAVRYAVASGSKSIEGRCRTALARALAFSDRTAEAALETERAEPMVTGRDLGDLYLQRMVVLYKAGSHRAALVAANNALHLLDDPIGRARALNNRGVLRLYVGGFVSGLADLVESEAILRAHGMTFNAAMARTNVAMMRERLGDTAAALRDYDLAISEVRAFGSPVDRHLVYRADVLLSAFLVDEVADTLPDAINALEKAGMRADAGEGRLYLAQALVLSGDDGAVEAARSARALLTSARRWGWAALARHAEVQALVARGDVTGRTLRLAQRSVVALEAAGLVVSWREALLIGGEIAATLGRRRASLAYWEQASQVGGGALLAERVLAAEARARRLLATGREGPALASANRGLRLVEAHLTTLAATDIRASAVIRGTRLASLGLGVAWRRRDARLVFRWAERWRAASLWLGPVQSTHNPELAELLGTLRQAARELRDEPPDPTRVARKREHVAALERTVRDTARFSSADSAGDRALRARPPLRVILDELNGRVLLHFVEDNGRLAAVVVDARRFELIELGHAEPIVASAESLRFAARRLISLAPDRPDHQRASDIVARHLEDLETKLTPLSQRVRDREVVIVPTGDLHATPWTAVFATATGVSVAPSASSWVRAAQVPFEQGHVVAAAGPGLEGATTEARRVGAVHDRSVVLTGDRATVSAVAAAVEGAAIAHLAAHATIRRDNPLFSSLQLADGAVTAYDLEQVTNPPRLLVMAACSSAVGRSRFGSDVVGLASVLLAGGTRAVLASVTPLADGSTVGVMERFHIALAEGATPAVALLNATADDTLASRLSRLALVCLGAG